MNKDTKDHNAVRPMNQLWLLARTFLLIGGFTFGGGHAMLELIRREVVDRYHWMDDAEFIDLFAMAQSLPGVFAVNISIFVGYRLRGILGAVICAFSCTLPSFLIILSIAIYASRFKDNPHIEAIFKGMRPAVVALIAAPCVSVWRALKLGIKWIWIPIIAAVSVWYFGISPVTVILLSALLGWIYTMFISKELTKKR